MSEVRVIARCAAREGEENQLRTLLQGMLVPTRAEPGCILYDLYESNLKGRFYFYERWESKAALDRHVATPHFKHLEQTLGKFAIEPLEANILETILPGAPGG
jgi:quinol monooxygenase YgiN